MKKILKYIWGLIAGFNKQDKQAILDAIEITNNIKNYVYSPLVDGVVAITPTTLDDKILGALRVNIHRILKDLRLSLDADYLTLESNLLEAKVTLDNLPKTFKGDMLDAIACNIVPVLSRGRVSWDVAKTVVKTVYDEIK